MEISIQKFQTKSFLKSKCIFLLLIFVFLHGSNAKSNPEIFPNEKLENEVEKLQNEDNQYQKLGEGNIY